MASPADTEDLKDQQKTEASSTSDTDQTDAESSDPNKSSETEPSTFDVVMNAIKPEGEDEDGSSEAEKSDKAEGDEKPKDKKDGKADDDFEDFSPEERTQLKKATAERFDKLKGLYHKSKEQVTALTAQMEQTSTEAGYYRKFVEFLDENRLSQEEANRLFHIGAMMKNDPEEALKLITPYYNELLHITGNILPPDLQQQVTQGYITKDRALELSRLRATGQARQAINEERTVHQQQRDQHRHQQENVSTMMGAISDWERKWASSDPDYAKKKDRVLDRVELLLARAQRQNKIPQTVEDAVKLADQAKSEIELDLKQFKPRKQVSTVDGGSSFSNMPEARDTRDVIRRTLNQ